MTKKELIERDENGQLMVDIAPEAIKAEIQVSIDKLLKKREEARAKYGKLKRTTFETIEDKGMMNPDSLYEEYQRIEAKESALSSAERTMISQIVVLSMQEVFTRKIQEAKELSEALEKPAIAKKKRTKRVVNAKKTTAKKSAKE